MAVISVEVEQGKMVEVSEVLDRWLAPDHRYAKSIAQLQLARSKVLGDDGAIYTLRHHTERWVWELTLYESGSER